MAIGTTVKKFVGPIGTAFKNLSTGRKAAVAGAGASLAGLGYMAGSATGGNTTINKISFDEIAEASFQDELKKLANEKGLKKLIKGIAKKHPEVIKEVAGK